MNTTRVVKHSVEFVHAMLYHTRSVVKHSVEFVQYRRVEVILTLAS